MLEKMAPYLRVWSALGGTRTPNLLIRSQMLYPLSYERMRLLSLRHRTGGLRAWRYMRHGGRIAVASAVGHPERPPGAQAVQRNPDTNRRSSHQAATDLNIGHNGRCDCPDRPLA